MTSEEISAKLAAKAAEARRILEEAAAKGDARARRILAELDGTAAVELVDPKRKPLPRHWADGDEQ